MLQKVSKTLFISFTLLGLSFAAHATSADYSVDELRQMSQMELNQVYAEAQAGNVPDGESAGTAVFFPDAGIFNIPSQILASLFWQGKVFETEEGVLVNKVVGFRAIRAEVYRGESLFDGNESIIIDYSRTSILANPVRDEIREVAPGIYLGRAYILTLLGAYMGVNFILDFN
jgi:hypothetical protein